MCVGGPSSANTLQSIADYGAGSVTRTKEIFNAEENKLITRKPRYAITSSVQTASFTSLAVMLAYSIQKHNDLKAMDAELVLLVREDEKDGVTAENKTRLEKAGWTVRVAKELEFQGVDTGKIRPWHRHNLNKLHLWSWTEYEKILFIDADVVCKGSLAELWDMPGEFAAAPDVWWNILTDNRFNSGVVVFRPSMETFNDMIPKMSDPNYHSPNDADQAFLNAYYKFRYFGLPYKYNFNLVMYQFHRSTWDKLWDEAVLIHFTMRKPSPNPAKHCHKGCNEWEPLEWYGQYFREMLAYHGWEKELPVLA
ncbi:nucleotide-diphospho-sugar transferase [Tricharina praecox]|uniref:nucleotide-diphospho-sugar transferase n=1 Tax=Tricharina praecox TaxID=43433 RepID=UPI00221E6575|nr:nucleotide-diphospho-sugar transferase [Tricharina praecox]KAI5848300.1 nucleotide-diphospho-sugar transferase [Tricharina praecox]